MSKTFNLSEWALAHKSLVTYFMLVFSLAGVFSYLNLGREEDPAFTIKTMVITAQWPGASAEETTQQITDRIEKKLEELEIARFYSLDYHAGRDHDLRQPARHYEGAGCASHMGAGAQHDR